MNLHRPASKNMIESILVLLLLLALLLALYDVLRLFFGAGFMVALRLSASSNCSMRRGARAFRHYI